MGTETILQSGGGIGVHQQQQQRQPHGATSTNTHQRSSCLIDEDAAYGDAMKGSSLHTDSVGHGHHQQEQPPFVNGVKFPPVVGIYRPPAARRALNLAENVVHQLAPPAACEHPNDYGHLTPSTQHSPATGHQQVHLLLHTAAGDGTEPDKIIIAPDSTEGHPLGKDKPGKCEKTGHAGQETLQSSFQASVPECAGQIGSNDSTGNSDSRNSIGVTSPSARINRPPRERRPDRAVYVPRARRSLTTPPVATAQSQSLPPETTEVNVAKVSTSSTKGLSRTASNRVQLSEPATAAISLTSSVSSKEVVKLKDGKRKLLVFTSAEQLQSGNTDTLACDTVIEAPLRIQATDVGGGEVSLESLKKRGHSLEEQQELQRFTVALVGVKADREPLAVSSFYRNKHKEESHERDCGFLNTRPEEEASKENSDCNPETVVTMHRNNQRNRNVRNTTCSTTAAPLATGMLITDANEAEKIDRDETELRRASQEINRSNRRIMKQTFNSDVLEIGIPAPAPQKPVKVKRTPAAVVTESVEGQRKTLASATDAVSNGKTAKSEAATTAENGEEDADDWESMYDDNGDCLNPKMLEELTTAVGKVSIETPQSDYKLFETKQAVLNEEEFPHVLEVSNFPAEFKTQDLMMLFSQYKETGFDIKWVDDTHALAVFSSSKIAAEVLTAGLSFARVKPLGEATAESRSKARKCSSSLQPYRARPETCAAMARRMVTSALGVKLKTAPEERENERRLLREAKERKRLAAKQRDEVWDS